MRADLTLILMLQELHQTDHCEQKDKNLASVARGKGSLCAPAITFEALFSRVAQEEAARVAHSAIAPRMLALSPP
jgi:hypothetical protein